MRQPPSSPPPELFRLAGHPVRWRLLEELAEGDLRVGELTTALDLAQNLVSYHLRRLRAAGMVTARRSAADRRDTYYAVDLARCRALLADAGAALHPGLAAAGPEPWRPDAGQRPRVLFLCTANSSRSQMAEALLRRRSAGRVEAFSAGSRPRPLHPGAVRIMRERGIDISAARPKLLDVYAHERFDAVVSLCDRVREVCPPFAGAARTVHWSIPDPSAEEADPGDPDAPFRRVADALEVRLEFLLARIRRDAA